MSRVKNIYKLNNVNIINKINGTTWDKQRVLVIERFNGDREVFDIKNNVELTNTNFEVGILKKKTILKRIFSCNV